MGRLSIRKRFHTSDVVIVPSRNVGKARFESLEHQEAACQDEKGSAGADQFGRPIGALTEQNRP